MRVLNHDAFDFLISINHPALRLHGFENPAAWARVPGHNKYVEAISEANRTSYAASGQGLASSNNLSPRCILAAK